ncbi:MAG TPA: ABC transporter ATP-binding protein [Acidimicrobiales bacterium]|nr:ABC transporter ATP-binding protein [Acidimicrobiales bacterium]
MTGPAIRVEQLQVERGGRTVVRNISFTVPAGTLVGLLGPSGCGKTTLMRCLVGTQIVAGGLVEVFGRPAGSPLLRRHVGYVTQAPSVYGDLSVSENLRYFAAVLGTPAAAVDRVIGDVELHHHADTVVRRLSGGEQARVSLATALLASPRLLVLDEPTVGLDPVLRRDLWALFVRLARAGSTLIVSSHVMDEAEHCQRILLMRDGRILADDSPEALLGRTGSTDFDEAFIALIEDRST